MVYVLPLPVCPYAKMLELNPLRQFSTVGLPTTAAMQPAQSSLQDRQHSTPQHNTRQHSGGFACRKGQYVTRQLQKLRQM
jgi:hypothetical protein